MKSAIFIHSSVFWGTLYLQNGWDFQQTASIKSFQMLLFIASGSYSLPVFFVWIAGKECPNWYLFALTIARAMSFQNVMIPRVLGPIKYMGQ